MPKAIVKRSGDIHPDRALEVLIQNDGNVTIAISLKGVIIGDDDLMENSNDRSAFVEFCVSGGRSPHTLQALRDLVVAIEKDNEENPIF